MKIRVPGEKTKVPCERCQALQPGTWNYAPYELDEGRVIEQVMTASCDICSAPVSIATQSAWKLQEAKQPKSPPRTSVLVSLPLFDFAANTASRLGGEPKRGPELLTRAIFRKLSREPKTIPTFAKKLETIQSPLLENPAKRMNITLSPRLSDLLDRLKKETTLNQSEIIRRALVATESDPAVLEELKSLLDLYD